MRKVNEGWLNCAWKFAIFCVCFWQKKNARSCKLVQYSLRETAQNEENSQRQLYMIKIKNISSWFLWPFKCPFSKNQQLHYFIKRQQKTPSGQTLYIPPTPPPATTPPPLSLTDPTQICSFCNSSWMVPLIIAQTITLKIHKKVDIF